uniref:Uncharacterized protein n=1 Tax=Tetranychus urticae TaxID=32264 RepID=T1KR69_TETUR
MIIKWLLFIISSVTIVSLTKLLIAIKVILTGKTFPVRRKKNRIKY